jgi:hypothetical protein
VAAGHLSHNFQQPLRRYFADSLPKVIPCLLIRSGNGRRDRLVRFDRLLNKITALVSDLWVL